MSNKKNYNSSNFFKHTFCEFKEVNELNFPEESYFKSKSDSKYFYTDEGVYRKSNHWGRVANCRWKLITNKPYKNQEDVLGFAKWTDFYPLSTNAKNFTILVDFEKNTAQIKTSSNSNPSNLLSYSEAQKKCKKINHLLSDDKWSYYYQEDITTLRKKIILNYINSNSDLQTIKLKFRK